MKRVRWVRIGSGQEDRIGWFRLRKNKLAW